MKKNKKLDTEIDRIYRENCEGIQISILDIGKVFDAGRLAHAEGRDIKEAIVDIVQKIRKN